MATKVLNMGKMLLANIVVLCLVGCVESGSESVGRISIGMDKTKVVDILNELGASDIGGSMQTVAQQKADLQDGSGDSSNWMWGLKRPAMSIETKWENDKLVQINVWDWRNRKQTSYHNTMEYLEVSNLMINPHTNSIEVNVIQIHNQNAGE